MAESKKSSGKGKSSGSKPQANRSRTKPKQNEQPSEAQKTEEQSNELQTGRASWKSQGPDQSEDQVEVKLGEIEGVQLENHRADVNPGDQVAKEKQRQAELDAARRLHNKRTAGRSA